jgi:hypothetical protein
MDTTLKSAVSAPIVGRDIRSAEVVLAKVVLKNAPRSPW